MHTRLIVASCALLLVGLMLTDAGAQTSPDIVPQLVCGLDVYPSPTAQPDPEPSPDPQVAFLAATDVCLTGVTVFGPQTFHRADGSPGPEIAQFALESAGDVCLISEAASQGKPFIYLDGEQIANARNFNDQVDQQVHPLAAGPHELSVNVVGPRPKAAVEVDPSNCLTSC
jgi:hypothetical protein